MYGNDVASSFELVKGFTRPVLSKSEIRAIPNEIVEAHVNLSAKRKLNRILRSHVHRNEAIKIGDMVQVYVKNDKSKRGSWSSPRILLSIDDEAGSVVVPGRGGQRMSAAFEDLRLVPCEDPLSTIVQSAIDELDSYIDELVNVSSSTDTPSSSQEKNLQDGSDVDVCDFSGEKPMRPSEGDRVEIFWPLDDTYYPGKVTSIEDDGRCTIEYDDEVRETLNMVDEVWRFEQQSVNASTLGVIKTLTSNEQEVLSSMMEQLGQRPFLLHHAQGFEQSVLHNAYEREEQKYIATVKRVQRRQVPRDANIVSSHVVYKIKVEDDDSLPLKARIAPQGNEDSDTENHRSDCCTCAPIGIRAVTTVAAIRRWRIVKIDVEMAFHQSGPADRKVYVRPPRESRLRNELWLLLVAGHGLINVNSKWQAVSDDTFVEIGLEHLAAIPQFFIKLDEQRTVLLLVIKIVDDILACGTDDILRSFVVEFGENLSWVLYHMATESSVFMNFE